MDNSKLKNINLDILIKLAQMDETPKEFRSPVLTRNLPHVEKWVKECGLVHGAIKVTSLDLYRSYTSWCKKNNIEIELSDKNFGKMISKFFKKKRTNSGWRYFCNMNPLKLDKTNNEKEK